MKCHQGDSIGANIFSTITHMIDQCCRPQIERTQSDTSKPCARIHTISYIVYRIAICDMRLRYEDMISQPISSLTGLVSQTRHGIGAPPLLQINEPPTRVCPSSLCRKFTPNPRRPTSSLHRCLTAAALIATPMTSNAPCVPKRTDVSTTF